MLMQIADFAGWGLLTDFVISASGTSRLPSSRASSPLCKSKKKSRILQDHQISHNFHGLSNSSAQKTNTHKITRRKTMKIPSKLFSFFSSKTQISLSPTTDFPFLHVQTRILRILFREKKSIWKGKGIWGRERTLPKNSPQGTEHMMTRDTVLHPFSVNSLWGRWFGGSPTLQTSDRGRGLLRFFWTFGAFWNTDSSKNLAEWLRLKAKKYVTGSVPAVVFANSLDYRKIGHS